MAFNSKLLIVILLQFMFCQISYSNNFYDFNYLLCDSLKNANYNFGIKNSKKNLVIYKLKNQSFKKTKIIQFNTHTLDISLTVDGIVLDNVTDFCYLGHTIF